VEALGIDGDFGTLRKSRFNKPQVSGTKDIAVAHAFVVTGGGKSLRTLVIGTGMYEGGRGGEKLVHDFVNHCPNVTSLGIAEGDIIGRTSLGTS